MVVIPRNRVQKAAAPRPTLPPTPSNASKAPNPTTPYPRRHGKTLHLTDRALARIPQHWMPPSDDAVHVKPLPTIFFRFWSKDQTHCYNSEDGFIGGKYIQSNLVPRKPPLIEHLDTTDIVNHVEGLKIATPVRVADICLSLYRKPLTLM